MNRGPNSLSDQSDFKEKKKTTCYKKLTAEVVIAVHNNLKNAMNDLLVKISIHS